LEVIATLRPEIDGFFAKVMVMDPDQEIRQQRLSLLYFIQMAFLNIADFSEIVVAG
jgi:glycyl-tRNA synthetase beta chain